MMDWNEIYHVSSYVGEEEDVWAKLCQDYAEGKYDHPFINEEDWSYVKKPKRKRSPRRSWEELI